MRTRGWSVPAVAALAALAALAATLAVAGDAGASGRWTHNGVTAASTSHRVLLVGTFHGHHGQYRTIQTAVDAAKPGDWILVAPGDYHPQDDHSAPVSTQQASQGDFGGVVITTRDLHLRGMNRNTVVVDGTKPGAPTACDATPKWQDLGAVGPTGKALGRNGIVVFKANDVWVTNLTTCNFLGGAGSAGNGIWWDGGSGTGTIGLKGYWGSYLTATSTYYGPVTQDATYGIFANSAAGPAKWTTIYTSNFNDSGVYVGACRRVCNVTIDHAWSQYNALGYSGTNSGGAVVIEHSQFDHNEDGFDTNTQIRSDPPPPQNGACPHGGTSKITHTHSCWVFMDNYVHTNNNPNVPEAPGYAAAGPVGTGMTVSGGRNDTVMHNVFANNGAWGVLFVPFPDHTPPFHGVTCASSGGHEVTGFGCVYDPEGNALLHNTFRHNGYFGNPTNGDFGRITLFTGEPQNCFVGNKAPNGSAPANLEKTTAKCGTMTKKATNGGALFTQVLCDTGFGSCPAGASYPARTGSVVMRPLPKHLTTMPNPCKGVPANAWCRNGKPV